MALRYRVCFLLLALTGSAHMVSIGYTISATRFKRRLEISVVSLGLVLEYRRDFGSQ